VSLLNTLSIRDIVAVHLAEETSFIALFGVIQMPELLFCAYFYVESVM